MIKSRFFKHEDNLYLNFLNLPVLRAHFHYKRLIVTKESVKNCNILVTFVFICFIL